jgi:hypothetical protein
VSLEYESDDDEVEDDEDLDDDVDTGPRWVGVVTMLGLALVAVIVAQVVASIIEGFMVRADRMEPTGIETDLLHRLGFPFGNLGPPAALFLVVALVLISLPTILGEETSDVQDRLVGVALAVIAVVALIIALGGLLAVRNSLHEYTGRNSPVPPYARVGFTSFLLGTLGTAAAALFGALAMINARKRRP